MTQPTIFGALARLRDPVTVGTPTGGIGFRVAAVPPWEQDASRKENN